MLPAVIIRLPWFLLIKGALFRVQASATTLGPIIILDDTVPLDAPEVMHERIHLAQWRELLYIGFPIVFWAIYLYRLARLRDAEMAYLHHAMEAEAFRYMDTPDYLATRKPFAWARLS